MSNFMEIWQTVWLMMTDHGRTDGSEGTHSNSALGSAAILL